MCYKSTVIKMLDVVIPCYNYNNKRFGHEWVQMFETVTCSRLHISKCHLAEKHVKALKAPKAPEAL